MFDNYINSIAIDSLGKIATYKEEKGIFKIKPKSIFSKTEDLFDQPVEIVMNIPSSNIGSLSVLEAVVIVSLLKIFKPKNIFEFGTFLGYSTHLFLRNSEMSSKVYTIDLDLSNEQIDNFKQINIDDALSNDIKNDNYLSYLQQEKGHFYISNCIDENRLTIIKHDSISFNYEKANILNGMDFIFIDGGHDFNTIKSDTENALKMLKENGVIVWHDFNSTIHEDVTLFLKDFSKNTAIYHIEFTMIAFAVLGSKNNSILVS